MIFARIDHQLRIAAERLQCLIHLLAPQDRNIPINGTAHEKRRRHDIFHAIKRSNLVPNIDVFPRRAKLGEVVLLILIVAVEAGELRRARSRDGSLEAIGLTDDEIRRDAAVRPSSDAEFVRIGNSLCNGVVHHGHVVLVVPVAPIGPDGFAVVLPVAG